MDHFRFKLTDQALGITLFGDSMGDLESQLVTQMRGRGYPAIKIAKLLSLSRSTLYNRYNESILLNQIIEEENEETRNN